MRLSRTADITLARVDPALSMAIVRPLRDARLIGPTEGPCGGTGRRARLKIEFRKECWFDSGQGHHASPFGLRVARPRWSERRNVFEGGTHSPKGEACPAKPLGEDGLSRHARSPAPSLPPSPQYKPVASSVTRRSSFGRFARVAFATAPRFANLPDLSAQARDARPARSRPERPVPPARRYRRRYIEAFDEAPLSVDIAEIACRRRSKASICTETPRAASPTSTVWRPASCAGDRQDEFAHFNFAIMRRAATASRRMTPEL